MRCNRARVVLFALLAVFLAGKASAASAPGPNACQTLSNPVGPGYYKINGTDRLLQSPRETFICPSGGMQTIVTYHASTGDNFYSDQAAGASDVWTAGQLKIYCMDPNSYHYTIELPESPIYTPHLYVDTDQPDPQRTTQETSYLVTPTSQLWLRDIRPGSQPVNNYGNQYHPHLNYPPDANPATIQCQNGDIFVGVTIASSYGGIDYLEFLCAPSCWSAPPGTNVALGGGQLIATVGQPFLDPLSSSVKPPPPPGICSNAIQTHIGPGATWLYATSEEPLQDFPGFRQPAPIVAVCPGESFIKSWDLRGQYIGYPSPTGERVASVGASCSDDAETKLPPVPLSFDLDNYTMWGKSPPGPDVYFVTDGTSGVNDDDGWNSFPIIYDGPDPNYGFYGIGLFLGGLGQSNYYQATGPSADYGNNQKRLYTCPDGQRAIGYTAASLAFPGYHFTGDAVDLLDIICAPKCGPSPPNPIPVPPPPPPISAPAAAPNASGPSTSPSTSPSNVPSPPPPANQGGWTEPNLGPFPSFEGAYGCGSTVKAHIGPGNYTALNLSSTYYTTECPAGTYINSITITIGPEIEIQDSMEPAVVPVTSLGATCGKDQNGADGGPQLITVTAKSADNQPLTFVNHNGFEHFPVRRPDGLVPVLNIDPTNLGILQANDPSQRLNLNATTNCPSGFNAIGYTAAASDNGITYLDVLCGPPLPPQCPPDWCGYTPAYKCKVDPFAVADAKNNGSTYGVDGCAARKDPSAVSPYCCSGPGPDSYCIRDNSQTSVGGGCQDPRFLFPACCQNQGSWSGPDGNGGGWGGGGGPPFVYTCDPGGPSWQNTPVPPGPVPCGKGTWCGHGTAPPPPNAPGNSINLGNLLPSQIFLEIVLGITGPHVNPFTKVLQDGFNHTIQNITRVTPGKNVTYIGYKLMTTSSGRRHLLEEDAMMNSGRHLLADQTVDATYDINCGTSTNVALFAEWLAEAIQNGTFLSLLPNYGITAGDVSKVTLVSTKAQSTASQPQADTTSCTRKFGTICIKNSSLTTGDIAGIIIGGCVFIILVVAIGVWLVMRRRGAQRI